MENQAHHKIQFYDHFYCVYNWNKIIYLHREYIQREMKIYKEHSNYGLSEGRRVNVLFYSGVIKYFFAVALNYDSHYVSQLMVVHSLCSNSLPLSIHFPRWKAPEKSISVQKNTMGRRSINRCIRLWNELIAKISGSRVTPRVVTNVFSLEEFLDGK
jgi:hypothetical protein